MMSAELTTKRNDVSPLTMFSFNSYPNVDVNVDVEVEVDYVVVGAGAGDGGYYCWC